MQLGYTLTKITGKAFSITYALHNNKQNTQEVKLQNEIEV